MRHSDEHCESSLQVCNLRLIDNIEQIGHSDANIEWSSDEHLDLVEYLGFQKGGGGQGKNKSLRRMLKPKHLHKCCK